MIRRAALLSLAVALGGCDAHPTLTARSEEPVVYLVLTRDPVVSSNPTIPGETRLTAVLATAGVPSPVEFRNAEDFTMWRETDSARFAWTALTPEEIEPLPSFLLAPRSGNYALPDTATAEGLGRADLRGGERYYLRILTGGRVITGTAVLPAAPELAITDDADGLRVVWRPVPGAAAYLISQAGGHWSGITRDTVHVVDRDALGQTDRLRVTALDANVAMYLSDSSAAVAGLVGGLGLFGGTAQAEIGLPPRIP